MYCLMAFNRQRNVFLKIQILTSCYKNLEKFSNFFEKFPWMKNRVSYAVFFIYFFAFLACVKKLGVKVLGVPKFKMEWKSESWTFPPECKMVLVTRLFLLPCQWKYWHRAKNRLRDKTEFGMYNPQNVEKSGFGQLVCVSVCLSVCLSVRLSVLLSVCLAVAFPASSHSRKV